ncbi:FadR/GntR family transcriptional regulator [Streptomyces sp. TLI_105]|uniref:FadR/GntR family transcriptional regulator n=1 Tax=Streptomyces sp. TLI_105 TaxID=1881019 RepID=UPI00089BCAE3|nr:FCD domain-containing protein [Streptomyces sp. TLI_105]SEE05309.1 transcriptional regulator, GntR family [Streptomyces sp. TLI_105]
MGGTSASRNDGAGKRNEKEANGAGPRQAPSHAVVADALRQRIALGGFGPGDRLPTERDLAAVFGVGRNTVRQAVRELADEGLVVTTLGRSGGTRVAPAPRSGRDSRAAIAAGIRASLRDYMEYRQAIEPFAARLAAERGAAASRRGLVEMLEAKVADLGEYHRVDTRFHLGVAEAGGNEVLAEAVTRARTEMFVAGNALWLGSDWTPVYPTDRDFGRAFREEHEAIALAVLSGDGDTAERRMREHLKESHQQFLVLLDQFASTSG